MKEKEKLEFILAAHKPVCKIPADFDSGFLEASISSMQSLADDLNSQTRSTISADSILKGTETISSKSSPFFSSNSATEASSSMTGLSDLERSLEESLDLLESLKKSSSDAAQSVPDTDLSSSFNAPDWEPLCMPSVTEFEPLCTPVVTCTPSYTTYASSFVFTYPEDNILATCGVAHRRGSNSNDQSSDSLSSPTLLALWSSNELPGSVIQYKDAPITGLWHGFTRRMFNRLFLNINCTWVNRHIFESSMYKIPPCILTAKLV